MEIMSVSTPSFTSKKKTSAEDVTKYTLILKEVTFDSDCLLEVTDSETLELDTAVLPFSSIKTDSPTTMLTVRNMELPSYN